MAVKTLDFERVWICYVDGVRVIGVSFRDENCDRDVIDVWFKIFVPGYSIMELSKQWHQKLVSLENFIENEYLKPLYGVGFCGLPTEFLPEGAVYDFDSGGTG
jgi:hypothetical protein